MTGKRWASTLLILGVVLMFPAPAHANAVLPMIIVGWLGMIPALIPIILVESAMLMRTGAHMGESILAMSAANLASTLVGIPLAIILEGTIGVLTRGALYRGALYHESWDRNERRLSKWLPVGGVLLLIPFFLLSWWIEAPIAFRLLLDELPAGSVHHAVRDANLVSYSILALLIGGGLSRAVWRSAQPRANERHVDSAALLDPWRIANRRAGRGIAKLKAKETKIARRYQARPMYSADFHETWRLANEHARRGITWLRVAEKIINRQRQTASADFVRRTEDTKRDKAA